MINLEQLIYRYTSGNPPTILFLEDTHKFLKFLSTLTTIKAKDRNINIRETVITKLYYIEQPGHSDS